MTVTERLDLDVTGSLEAKIDRLSDHVAFLVAESERQARNREWIGQLLHDAAPLEADALNTLVEKLAALDAAGYFDFVRAGAGVVDRVVTNFDEDDVRRLGDNVVAILEALREVTQPEMLAFLRRMVGAVQAEQAAVAAEPAEPPSLWALARRAHDPDVRRGIGRALDTLRAVSIETGPRTRTARTREEGALP